MPDRTRKPHRSSAARKVHGPAVRAIREARGIAHGVFAVECLISPGFLTRIEQGLKQPSAENAAMIAKRLGVPLDAITYEVPTCPSCHKQDVAA